MRESSKERSLISLKDYMPRLELADTEDIPEGERYMLLPKGSVDNFNAIVEHFDVIEIRARMTDGTRLRLIRDEDAIPGQIINTYA